MPIPIAYNVRNLRRRPISTISTALQIALVVAILIGTLALANGFRAAVVRTGIPENAIIVRKNADSEIASAITREQASIIRALPEIALENGRPLASAEMVVLTNLERIGQAGSSNIPLRGIEAAGLPLRSSVSIVSGRMFTPGTSELVVGERIARRFARCRIGDTIRFGQRDFIVVGHFAAAGSAFESEIWGDASVLGAAFDRDVFQSVTVRMKDPTRFSEIERLLETDPRLGVDVFVERAWYESQSTLLAGFIQGSGVFLTLIMAVGGVFGAVNTMYAAVGARSREIAVLLTLGFSPGSVMLSFLAESVLLSLFGGLLGCALSLFMNGMTTSTTNWASFSEVAFAFRVTPGAMAIGMGAAALMGVAGGLLPARRAAKQPLAQGMRG